MLSMWQSGPMPIALAQKFEKEIRYVTSSDIAYGARKIRGIEPAGIDIDELIDDVCTVMKIPIKKVGTIEGKLEYLAKRIVDKTFMEQPPEEQVNILKKLNISEEQVKKILKDIKEHKEKLIPVLVIILGKEAALNFANTILIGIIVVFVGKKTAEQLLYSHHSEGTESWMSQQRIPSLAIRPLIQSVSCQIQKFLLCNGRIQYS